MDPRNLIVQLERPLREYRGVTPVREIILAGLRWPTDYWPSLAVAWIEQGAEVDNDIIKLLNEVASKDGFPQKLRHQAFAIAHRKGNGGSHAQNTPC
ncbi:hypothetical protein [Rheinheimera tilapiae]|uniref:Uncharacterized protein n=1 Tax=Rheinheimera tilapiae TaxID=875043 RepID=A0ABV6BAQ3_9GAMM